MATFVKYQSWVGALGVGGMNLNTDTLKLALTNTAPNVATHSQFSQITEISAGNGYPAGGVDIQNTYSASGGTGTLAAVDVTFTASGGSIGPFRYAVIYDDTTATKHLMGYYDYGSSVTLAAGETFTVDFGAALATLT
jgi:hypothetical protein